MNSMELTTYPHTDLSKVAIPALCVDLRVYLLGDEEGPELHVYSEEKRKAANDD